MSRLTAADVAEFRDPRMIATFRIPVNAKSAAILAATLIQHPEHEMDIFTGGQHQFLRVLLPRTEKP